MIDSYFRAPYQKILVYPILKFSIFQKITPTALTGLSCLCGILTFVFLVFHFKFLALLVLLLSGYFDTLDGSLARALQKTSEKGAVFDIVSDRLCEFFVILGLFSVDPPKRAFLCLCMLGAAFLCVTSFLVIGIFSKNHSNKSFYYSPGLIERAEAFIFFSLMIVFPSLFMPLAYLFAFLTFLTTAIRLYQFQKPILEL